MRVSLATRTVRRRCGCRSRSSATRPRPAPALQLMVGQLAALTARAADEKAKCHGRNSRVPAGAAALRCGGSGAGNTWVSPATAAVAGHPPGHRHEPGAQRFAPGAHAIAVKGGVEAARVPRGAHRVCTAEVRKRASDASTRSSAGNLVEEGAAAQLRYCMHIRYRSAKLAIMQDARVRAIALFSGTWARASGGSRAPGVAHRPRSCPGLRR